MMFVGAIPRECVEQAFQIMPMDKIQRAFVCCSGSFRFEQAISKFHPHVEIHSNDVSLMTTTLARAAMGEEEDFRFVNDLAWMEEHITDLHDRAAAMAVALKMCHFRGKNPHAIAHREEYRANGAQYIAKAREKVVPYLEALKISSFYKGDFRDHAERAISEDATVFAWPPLFKGDYEKFYSTIHNNVEWKEPAQYEPFNPRDLPVWIKRLEETGASYCVCSDHDLRDDGLMPVAKFWAGRSKKIYLYSSEKEKTSLRHTPGKSIPFEYTIVDTTKLSEKTEVTVVPIDSNHMNFIKDKYQLPGLVHTDGLMKFLVFLDGQLAGGFVYTFAKFGDRSTTIYLLSDFSVTRQRKISKLIAMLATGQESVQRFDLRFVQRTKELVTTAFTKRPVSMKYRSIFKLKNRKEGLLNYGSEVRRVSNQEIYRDWWKRYGKNATAGDHADD